MHSHKASWVHCASSLECNIKVLITGTCKRGALPFHVESRHQNKLKAMIFQYNSMVNEVYLYGTNKMGDFSNDEGVCIYLFRYHFVMLVTIIHVASSRDILDSVIK